MHLDRTFSAAEMQRIARGLFPRRREDKWFIYCEDTTLFFHRSWTGYGTCLVRFVTEGGVGKTVSAEVNPNCQQYSEPHDQTDIAMISYRILESTEGTHLYRGICHARGAEAPARPNLKLGTPFAHVHVCVGSCRILSD